MQSQIAKMQSQIKITNLYNCIIFNVNLCENLQNKKIKISVFKFEKREQNTSVLLLDTL